LDGANFKLTGRADRIDQNSDGLLDIIDYKTGAAPSRKASAAGFEPQAPLEAAMARAGAFPDVPAAETDGLYYVRLSGGKDPGSEARIDGPLKKSDAPNTAMDYADQYEKLLRDLIDLYHNPETAYRSQPRAQYVDDWGDYDRLARRGEWSAVADEPDGGVS